MDPEGIKITVTYDGLRTTVVHIVAETLDGALFVAEGRATRHPDDAWSELGKTLALARAWEKFSRKLNKATTRVLNGGEYGG